MALQEEFESQGNWLFKRRGHLPLIWLVAGLAFYLWKACHGENHPDSYVISKTYYETGCLCISLIGLAIRIFTIGHVAKNTSGRNTAEQVADSLNTTGIYSVVRHPLYLGNYFMWAGIALLMHNLWFVLVYSLAYWIYYERIMFAEEQFLRKKFGDVYLRWADKTPAFLPNLCKFCRSGQPFAWKKVLRQEKNGFCALFLLFALFHASGELLKTKPDYNWILFIAAAGSIVIYFILKYLKRCTAVLNDGK
ncbi:MAG: isoprenylcysteine carboxylmethyltransferase family protein [Prevotellaceae bacterium]|jgi:protein-S-isoprenylcysteine O-methyltransferase Ste14|nr:isoprenylcysteine carboxylmethyltransferase family protein [Prevotellaceae bacterium]